MIHPLRSCRITTELVGLARAGPWRRSWFELSYWYDAKFTPPSAAQRITEKPPAAGRASTTSLRTRRRGAVGCLLGFHSICSGPAPADNRFSRPERMAAVPLTSGLLKTHGPLRQPQSLALPYCDGNRGKSVAPPATRTACVWANGCGVGRFAAWALWLLTQVPEIAAQAHREKSRPTGVHRLRALSLGRFWGRGFDGGAPRRASTSLFFSPVGEENPRTGLLAAAPVLAGASRARATNSGCASALMPLPLNGARPEVRPS